MFHRTEEFIAKYQLRIQLSPRKFFNQDSIETKEITTIGICTTDFGLMKNSQEAR